jgi:hypothetical protein
LTSICWSTVSLLLLLGVLLLVQLGPMTPVQGGTKWRQAKETIREGLSGMFMTYQGASGDFATRLGMTAAVLLCIRLELARALHVMLLVLPWWAVQLCYHDIIIFNCTPSLLPEAPSPRVRLTCIVDQHIKGLMLLLQSAALFSSKVTDSLVIR